MIKTLRSSFLGALLPALILTATAAVAPVSPEAPEIAAIVDPSAAIPLRPGIFSIAADTTLGGYGIRDPAALTILHAIRPPFLRVPGGDTMNLWDWNSGTPRSEEQLLAFGESTANKKVVSALATRRRYAGLMGGPMTADRWAALAAEGSSEPLWGLNVTTMAPADNRTFLLGLRSAGLPARRFELGNELYLKIWDRQAPNPDVYVRDAKANAQQVKAVFPGAKVAVCITAPLTPGVGPPPAARSWDGRLARESFYDAVVLHAYAMSYDLGDLRNVTADEYARWALIRSSDVFLGRVYGWLGRVFPRREIWMTEWNLNNNIYQQRHPDERAQFLPAHTILSGLFAANVLLNTAAHPSNVALACVWMICGEAEFGLISGKPPREQPEFHVFRMLSPAIHTCDHIAPLALPGAPQWRGPLRFAALEAPAIEGFAFFSGGALRYLAFVNFTDRSVVVRLNSSLPCHVETLTGPELLPGWGDPDNGSLDSWAPPYERDQAQATTNAIALAPRSFSVATLQTSATR